MTNSNQAKIRLAIAPDAERLAILCEQLGYPSSPEEVQLRLAQIPQDDGDAVYVAERADGLIIGWVHVLVCQLVMCDRLAEIGGLVVEESDRLSGVGRQNPPWFRGGKKNVDAKSRGVGAIQRLRYHSVALECNP